MTKTTKYSLGALGLIFLLFLYNRNTQNSLQVSGVSIFEGERDDVYRILLTEDKKSIDLVRNDSTWSIVGNDSLVTRESQIDKVFDRLLMVKKESIRTSKKEKWEKFGVDDSLGRHIKIFDRNDNLILHYIFGNSGSDFQHNYVRENLSNDVYRTDDNVYFLLNCNPTYWGEKPPKPTPAVADSVKTLE